jgi:RHS repeat-associated protein
MQVNMKHILYVALAYLVLTLAPSAHASTVTYVYSDPQGTPLAEADASGNITATFDYRPYGAQALGARNEGPGYTGHVNDVDSGLVYMQARYYDPEATRFITTDPRGYRTGDVFHIGRYTYARNNPIYFIDPDGEFESPAWMRATIPGQVAWDNAVTSWESGDYGKATLFGVAMVSEQVLTVATLGEGRALVGGANSVRVGVSLGEAGELTAEEIRSINRSLGGVTELTGNADTVVANMAYRSSSSEKAAVAIRDIAGRHMFNDANKRTAQAVAEKILGSSVKSSVIRSVTDRVANGHLRTVEEIAKFLSKNGAK